MGVYRSVVRPIDGLVGCRESVTLLRDSSKQWPIVALFNLISILDSILTPLISSRA